MRTVNTSARRSPASKKPSRIVTRAKSSRLADELAKAIDEATGHFQGRKKLRSYTYNVPEHVDVRALRRKTGLSQAEFAGKYALNPRTVQEWEQGRTEPDIAVRAYLTVIERDPGAVERALTAGKRASGARS